MYRITSKYMKVCKSTWEYKQNNGSTFREYKNFRSTKRIVSTLKYLEVHSSIYEYIKILMLEYLQVVQTDEKKYLEVLDERIQWNY